MKQKVRDFVYIFGTKNRATFSTKNDENTDAKIIHFFSSYGASFNKNNWQIFLKIKKKSNFFLTIFQELCYLSYVLNRYKCFRNHRQCLCRDFNIFWERGQLRCYWKWWCWWHWWQRLSQNWAWSENSTSAAKWDDWDHKWWVKSKL